MFLQKALKDAFKTDLILMILICFWRGAFIFYDVDHFNREVLHRCKMAVCYNIINNETR